MELLLGLLLGLRGHVRVVDRAGNEMLYQHRVME